VTSTPNYKKIKINNMIFGKVNHEECDKEIKMLYEKNNILLSDMERGFKYRDDEHAREVDELKAHQEMAIKKLKSDHSIALDQRDFDLKNNKDQVVMAANKERDVAKEESAVLKKEVEMLRQLVDVSAGIIDVKDLVGNLIKALPKVDLTSLTVNTTSK